MEKQKYIIEFSGVSVAEGNKYAAQLKDEIFDAIENIEIERRPSNPNAQDFGATLVLILGAPAVVVLAKRIGDWLKLHRSAKITIKTGDGEIVAENITSEDAISLVERFSSKK